MALPADSCSLAGLRVLGIDDNATNRMILRAYLEMHGMQVDTAASGPAALELLRSAARDCRLYDLVIVDMLMPGMDGLEFARAVRADPQLHRPPLILATSYSERGHPERVHDEGIARRIAKPLRQSQLLDAVRAVLTEQRPREVGHPPASRCEWLVEYAPRILVAEDHPMNQRLITAQLARLGCRADVVGDGHQAVEALEKDAYDIVFMDCRMPKMDGFEATARIRGHLSDRNPRIIAMTANAMEGDREECLSAGMDDYVAKPIQLGDLLHALERALRPDTLPLGNGHRSVDSTATPISCVPVEHPLRLEVLSALRAEFEEGGDLPEFFAILELYVRNARRNLAAAREALDRPDMQTLGLAAHSLKGSSGSIGAARLAMLSERLEAIAGGRSRANASALLKELDDELDRVEVALGEATS